MKRKGYQRHDRMFLHIYRCKRNNPVKDGTEAVFPAHERKNESFFLMNENKHVKQTIQAADNKNRKSQPCQRAAHELIDVMHVFSPFITRIH
jgi:hypothetical protein